MSKLPSVSGRKAIRSLNRMGFIIVRQRGSHVYMQWEDASVTVPLHDPIKKTTLKSILNQAGISLEEFLENLWNGAPIRHGDFHNIALLLLFACGAALVLRLAGMRFGDSFLFAGIGAI